jgi:hypothetical protein
MNPEPTHDRETSEALDYLAISRLQAAYGDAVTRQAWHELVPMFLPDGPVRLDLQNGVIIEKTGPEEIGAFIATSIQRFDFFAFTIVNTVVEMAPDGRHATGRLYIRELRREHENRRWTTAYGLYRDSYLKTNGLWRFETRRYSTLARTAAEGEGMDVFPVPGA